MKGPLRSAGTWLKDFEVQEPRVKRQAAQIPILCLLAMLEAAFLEHVRTLIFALQVSNYVEASLEGLTHKAT